MENSQKTTGAASDRQNPKEENFLRQYDEVLNKNILHVFRKGIEETDRPHDHRAVKVIAGEIVHLRLDSLQGQADGIRIFLEQEQLPMYIWFSPDTSLGKIVFRLLYGGNEMREQYDLSEITREFLVDLIAKRFISAGSLIVS